MAKENSYVQAVQAVDMMSDALTIIRMELDALNVVRADAETLIELAELLRAAVQDGKKLQNNLLKLSIYLREEAKKK